MINLSVQKDFGVEFLDQFLDWVRENLGVEEVFSDNKITLYVQENLSVQDVFKDSDIIDYVVSTFSVNRVFDKNELNEWALDNGYVKEEN